MSGLRGRNVTSAWALLISGPEKPKDERDDKAAVVDPPAANSIADQRATMKAMRDHLTTYGTVVGGLASAILGGVGWATFTKFAPLPPGRGWLAVLVALAGAAALAGAINLTREFFAAQRRIVIDTDTIPEDGVSTTNDLTAGEVAAARLSLDDFALEENAVDAKAVERRAFRLERASHRYSALAAAAENDSDEQADLVKQAAAFAAESDRLLSRLDEAAMWACIHILEMRSRTVFAGWRTKAWSLSTAAGVLSLLLLADYSQGERDLVSSSLSCVTSLKDIGGYTCDTRGEPEPVPTASVAASNDDADEPKADLALMERLLSCQEAATGSSPRPSASPLPGSAQLVDEAIAACTGLPAGDRTPQPVERDES